MMDKIERIKLLTNQLNKYRDTYYNDSESLISDYEYDNLFDELKLLEDETGFSMSNSPCKTVGYEVKSELEKVKHSHPMLSLDKTKSTDDLIKFAGNQDCILSCKCDGLTVLLTYDNGKLVQAETRGDGEFGELITHNAKMFKNIPLAIPYKGLIEFEGEAIINYNDFEKINSRLSDNDKYKNPRNLASGSVRQLDNKIAKERNIEFILWKIPKGFDSYLEGLLFAKRQGFEVVPYYTYTNNSSDKDNIQEMIDTLKKRASDKGIGIDGMVMTYNNIEYGKSLGMTGHHPKHSIAFKFYDEEIESKLLNIEWQVGKSGQITPIAIFKPVEIEGTIVEKASLSNLSILKETLGYPYKGQVLYITKRNAIIPKVERAIKKDYKDVKELADEIDNCKVCPVCGGRVSIRQDSNSDVLICTNPDCKGKLLGKLTHFVSRDAMNIDGFSEATLQKFIDLGWLNNFADIYYLNCHELEMRKLEGFGNKSVDKLLKSIEDSKHTTLDRFINALSIPMVGKSTAKLIAKYCNYNVDIFESCSDVNWHNMIEGIGSVISNNINKYMKENAYIIGELYRVLEFESINVVNTTTLLDKIFVITGSLTHFTNRKELQEKIEQLGGKVSGSISSKTDYLINNDVNSNSSKNKKAKELGIPIISEEDFLNMIS